MFSDSAIDPDTIQAYLETEYHFCGNRAATLKIGEACLALASLHKAYAVDCSAYITACNPFSQSLDAAANAALHATLARELTRRGLSFIEGVGKHPSNKWAGEASFLVFGLTLEQAKTLGTRLQQNAIIWNGPDVVPQLILLK